MQEKYKEKIFPFPEVLVPKKWEIQEGTIKGGGNLCSNKKHGIMRIPIGDNTEDKFVRNHEMAHVAFSPEEPPKIPGLDPEIILAVEDCRLNLLMHRLDMNRPQTHTNMENAALIDRMMKLPDQGFKHLTLMATCTIATDNFKPFIDAWWKANKDDCNRALKLTGSAMTYMTQNSSKMPWHFDETIRTAKYLQEHFKYEEQKKEDQKEEREQYQERVSTAGTTGLPIPKMPKGLNPPSKPKISSDGMNKEQGDPSSKPQVAPSSEFVPWGTMKIQEPPCNVSLPGMFTGRNYAPVTEGESLRFPHRLLMDKAIFAYKKQRGVGGSVLIDASGSMDIQQNQFMKLLNASPAVVVAAYAGANTTGTLRILAKNRRRVADNWINRPDRGNNVVDGPALRWLSKQPEPRIWISDEGVAGVNHSCSEENVEEVRRICRMYRIKRLHSTTWDENGMRDHTADALKYLQDLAKKSKK